MQIKVTNELLAEIPEAVKLFPQEMIPQVSALLKEDQIALESHIIGILNEDWDPHLRRTLNFAITQLERELYYSMAAA